MSLPEQYLTSVIAAAITDTSSTEVVAGLSSFTSILVKDIDIMNKHASVDTAVDIISGDDTVWTLPAGAGKGTSKVFTPELEIEASKPLSLKSQDAATIVGAVRYKTGGR